MVENRIACHLSQCSIVPHLSQCFKTAIRRQNSVVGTCPVFSIFKLVVVLAFFLEHEVAGTASNSLAMVDVGDVCLLIGGVGADNSGGD